MLLVCVRVFVCEISLFVKFSITEKPTKFKLFDHVYPKR